MDNTKLPIIDQSLVDEFLTSKRNIGWSDSMVKRVRKRLAVFCVDYSENPIIVQNGFEEWKKKLTEQGLSACTVKEYVSTARQLMAYTKDGQVKQGGGKELDLTDKKYGELTVLKKAGGRKSSERSFLWECQCVCGKIIEIPANQLTKGNHTSCGCQKAARLKESNQYVDGTSLKMVFSETIRKDNTSGHKGVYIKDNRWAARIQYKGKRYYLGTFDKLEDAVRARNEAEEKIREDAKELLCK